MKNHRRPTANDDSQQTVGDNKPADSPAADPAAETEAEDSAKFPAATGPSDRLDEPDDVNSVDASESALNGQSIADPDAVDASSDELNDSADALDVASHLEVDEPSELSESEGAQAASSEPLSAAPGGDIEPAGLTALADANAGAPAADDVAASGLGEVRFPWAEGDFAVPAVFPPSQVALSSVADAAAPPGGVDDAFDTSDDTRAPLAHDQDAIDEVALPLACPVTFRGADNLIAKALQSAVPLIRDMCGEIAEQKDENRQWWEFTEERRFQSG